MQPNAIPIEFDNLGFIKQLDIKDDSIHKNQRTKISQLVKVSYIADVQQKRENYEYRYK